MRPDDFIARWKNNKLTERAGAQAHFDDLCELLGVEKPRDPNNYCFERGAKKSGGGVHFAMLSALAIVVIWSPLGLWLTWRDAPAYTPQAWALLAASGLVHVLYFSALLAGYRAADIGERRTGPVRIFGLLSAPADKAALTWVATVSRGGTVKVGRDR